jgi:hypothetical protein
MSDDDLLSQISAEESRALGYFAGDLSREREKALDYYHGNLDVQAAEGRSDVVSMDVRDTVDGMLPDLLDVFLSSDDVVKFEPNGPEDEKAAQQATDATNYVFYRQNKGALVLYEWMKSALLEKNGVVKYYHEKYSAPSHETYEGLNEMEFQQLVNQEGVKVLQHSAAPDPSMQGQSLHDVQVRIVDQNGKVCITGVPSEEFLICADHNSVAMNDVRFVEHQQPLTVSAIRAMGIDVDPEESDDVPDVKFSPEYLARRRFNEEVRYGDNETKADRSQKILTFREISMLVDKDGDGLAERRRIVKIGKTIYENDYADHVPFAAICPNIMPYRFYGLSEADNTADIQKQKSMIWRGMIDSLFLSLNPRIGVMESMVNLDDLLVQRIGGVVRFKTNPNMAMMPMEHRFVGQQAFPMMEYMDSVKENRTGFTRYSQGMDADSLNKTARGMSIITASSQKRLKLIARMFAETGVKDLMQGIKHLLIKHRSGKPLAMRLRGQWVNVDPREWKTQWDMTVNVGLGTNDKPAQAAHIQSIIQVQAGLKQVYPHMVTDVNAYNSAKKMAETAGYKQEGEFFTPPGPHNPPPPPPPNPELEKIKAEAGKVQFEAASAERIKQMEVMNGQHVAEVQKQVSIAVAQIKAETELQIAHLNAAAQERLKRMEIDAGAAVEVFKAGNEREMAQHEAQTQERLADKQAEHSITSEVVKAAAKPKDEGKDAKPKPNGEDKGEQKALVKMMAELARASTADREVMRDAQGNIIGVRIKKS